MPRVDLSAMHCSIARTFGTLGDAWSALILRDVFVGIRRFDELQEDLGIARNILSARLDHLLEEGILETQAYQEHPVRYDYVLSAKGRDLVPVLLALMAWGDRWLAGRAGPPARIRHERCGAMIEPAVACPECGDALRADDISVHAGPGGRHAPGTTVIARRLTRAT